MRSPACLIFALSGLTCGALAACSSGETPEGTGGTTSSGGAGAIGGTGGSTGGSSGSGVGGTSGGTGGNASGSGGASASGGSASGSGGGSATGGMAGTSSLGGRAGAATGGTGGLESPGGEGGEATSGGSAGVGGGGGNAGSGGTGGATPSSGCGKAAPANDRYTIDVGGEMREYILNVPMGYDMNKPYRLVFTWHPLGGSAQQTAGSGNNGYYGLVGASAGEAILVSPEGLPFSGSNLGWGNTNGRDIEFLEAMLAKFKSELCIDESRIFSTGFSFGGMMSNAVACSGLARAVAPMAGNSMVSGCAQGTTPVAYMGFHGDDDTVVAISGGEAARDTIASRNHCTEMTMPAETTWCDGAGSTYQPCECVSFQGCDAGFPVTWCQYNGSHMVAPNSAATIWSFFMQF